MSWTRCLGRGPAATGVRIGIGIAQGLAPGRRTAMIGVSTLATMAQGAWRKPAPPVCWRPLMRVWAKSTGRYQRDEQGVWHGEDGSGTQTGRGSRTAGTASGEWAYRHRMAGVAGSGESERMTLSGEIELPAEDILPLACYLLAAGKPWPGKAEPFICETRWRGRNSRPQMNPVTRRLRKESHHGGSKQGVRWLLAAAVAVVLSGCVSVPDTIRHQPTPQQDLVRVMNARSCTLARRALAVSGQCTQTRGKPAKIATVPLDSARGQCRRAVPRKDFADVWLLDPVDSRSIVTVSRTDRRVVDGKWARRKFVLMNATGYKLERSAAGGDASATYRPVDAGSAPLGLRL